MADLPCVTSKHREILVRLAPLKETLGFEVLLTALQFPGFERHSNIGVLLYVEFFVDSYFLRNSILEIAGAKIVISGRLDRLAANGFANVRIGREVVALIEEVCGA